MDLTESSRRVIAHGMLVLLLGLVAGVGLIFALLGGVGLWPIPVFEMTIPGSVRGWQAAHVGGLMNGIFMAVVALLMTYLGLEGRDEKWTQWGAIIMGWGNTAFYIGGNFSQNRGLSAGATPFGDTDLFGVIAFLGGGIAMFVTFVFVVILARAALRPKAA